MNDLQHICSDYSFKWTNLAQILLLAKVMGDSTFSPCYPCLTMACLALPIVLIQFWAHGCYQNLKITSSHDSPITETLGKISGILRYSLLSLRDAKVCWWAGLESPACPLSLPPPAYARKQSPRFKADVICFHNAEIIQAFSIHSYKTCGSV